MGLILPQTVEVKLNAQNKEHYKNLGYNCTKVGDVFMCDIKDLSHGSTIRVDVQCDFCQNISQIIYKSFLKLQSSKYCCPDCLSHKKKARDINGNLIFVEIPYRNKEWLFQKYIVENIEAQELATQYGINVRTLREWISTFDLTNLKRKTSNITKEELFALFVENKMTTIEIGKLYGVTDGSILYLLKKFNIASPPRSELMRRYYYEKGGLEKAREKYSDYNYRVLMSCRNTGVNPKDFLGFKRSENERVRNSSKYKEWRKRIFERDGYICQCCGKKGGNLHSHHIQNFSDFPELRTKVDNGITLCEKCHSIKHPNSFHAIYGERDNTYEQLKEYIDFIRGRSA